MRHFGIITPPVPGHVHPFGALGRELQSRGHRVTVFHMADLETRVRAEGLDFRPIGRSDHPAGSLPASLAALGKLKGLRALTFTIRAVARTSTMFCRDGPDAIRAAGVDALLVDQMEPAGGAIAEHLGIPFVTVCNALAINRDTVTPPPFTPWTYQDRWWSGFRNRVGYALSDRLTRPIGQAVDDFRRRWSLRLHKTPDESFSSLAQISQMPKEFDFPRQNLPDHFHYVGPLRGVMPKSNHFPWHRLDGRPLVYASLGTLQNSRLPVFLAFAEACRGLEVQLVLSHGGGLSEREANLLPGNPLVVSYAPQWELLARAAVTLTHAGLNTVLDSLANGVPLVAVPLTYEQPAIARRVEWIGAGRSLAIRRMTPAGLRRILQELLQDAHYREAAARLQQAIRTAGGVRRAAALVESAVERTPA